MTTQTEPQNETATSESLRAEKSVENFEKESQGAVEAKEPKKATWQDNPNDCDLKTQYVRKDNLECIDKPSASQRTENTNLGTPQRTAGGCEQYRSIVEQYDWDTNTAMAVMKAESGCNPSAANMNDHHGQCVGSFGLMQLACFHTANPTDPHENVRVAYRIYSQQGWQPWGAYTNGSYLQNI